MNNKEYFKATDTTKEPLNKAEEALMDIALVKALQDLCFIERAKQKLENVLRGADEDEEEDGND